MTGPDAGPAQATVVVMAKAPEPGKVKTRLSPAFTAHQAAALAAAALLDTLDVVAVASQQDPNLAGPVVAMSGDLDQAAAPGALHARLADFTVIEQRGNRFSDRLVAAHRDAAGAFGATVQVGMDTPQLSVEQLQRAAGLVLAEDGPDAVLGMAPDGGWWLLALRRGGDARLIADVAMSTVETGRLTREALENAGLEVIEIDSLRDVDEPDDVVAVAAAAPQTRFARLHQVLAPGAASAGLNSNQGSSMGSSMADDFDEASR